MLAWQIATESSRRAMSALACLPMHLRSLWATLSITDRIAALLLAASSTIFYFLNLSWGMPHNQYGDEWAIINSTLMLPYRLGDPRLYFYGVPYMYVYAVVIGVVFAVQFLFGLVSGPTDFAVAFLRDPTAVVLTGRLISALCGVGVALLSYALARRFLPAAWAFVVAAAAAWTEVAVRMAHYAKTDQFFALLYLAVVWLALSAQRSRRRALAALLLAGVSVACKLPAVALGPVLVVMLFFDLRTEQKSSWRAALSHPLFWLSPLLCAVGFFLVNPWAMIRLPSLIAQIFTVESMYGVEGSHAGPFDSSLYYLNLLWKNVGPVGLVLSLFSLTLPFVLRERRRDAAILAAAVWPFLLLVCATRHHDFHWLLPVTSLLLIGGAVALHHLVAQTATRWRRAFTIAAGFAGVALLLQTGYMGIRTAWLFGLPSTKDQAREWVEVNVPAGTAIALDTGRYLPSGTLHLRQDPQRLAEMIDMEKGLGIEVAAGGTAEHYLRMLARANEGLQTYRLYPILHGVLWKTASTHERNTLLSLAEYRALGVRYIIVSDYYYRKYFKFADRLDECRDYVRSYLAFYRDTLPTLPVAARFAPVQGESQGPTITVYRLGS